MNNKEKNTTEMQLSTVRKFVLFLQRHFKSVKMFVFFPWHCNSIVDPIFMQIYTFPSINTFT